MSRRTNEGPVIKHAAHNSPGNVGHISPPFCEVRELIARRAYELYEQRGNESGDDLSDWLDAEKEIVSLLLAERHEVGETEEVPNLPKTNRTRTAKSKAADRARPRLSRWSKRKNAIEDTPA